MNILDWVEQKMKELGIEKYTVRPELISIDTSSSVEFIQKNDFYFLINAFSSNTLPIEGYILGFDNAISLIPSVLNTNTYKYQIFSGMIKIYNQNDLQKLYVELLIVSPK